MHQLMNHARVLFCLCLLASCTPASAYTPEQIATLVAPGYDAQVTDGCPATVHPRADRIGMTIPPNALTNGQLALDRDFSFALQSTILASSGGWATVSLGGAKTMSVHAPAAGGGNMTIDSLNNVVFSAAIGAYVNSNAGDRSCGTQISAAGVTLVPVGTEFALVVRQLDKVPELQLAVYSGEVHVTDIHGAALVLPKGEALVAQEGLVIARFPAPPDLQRKIESGQDLFGNPLDSVTPAAPAAIRTVLDELLAKNSPTGVAVFSEDLSNPSERTVEEYLSILKAKQELRYVTDVPQSNTDLVAGQLNALTKQDYNLILLVAVSTIQQGLVVDTAKAISFPGTIYTVDVVAGTAVQEYPVQP